MCICYGVSMYVCMSERMYEWMYVCKNVCMCVCMCYLGYHFHPGIIAGLHAIEDVVEVAVFQSEFVLFLFLLRSWSWSWSWSWMLIFSAGFPLFVLATSYLCLLFSFKSVCMYVCILEWLYVFTYVCMYEWLLANNIKIWNNATPNQLFLCYACMFVCMYVCMHVFMYACVYVHTYLDMYVWS